MHTVCARLLRRIFDCEDETAAAYVTLCGIPDVLGPPQGGAAAGSFKIIDYRRASQNIDLDSLWRQGESEGHNTFDWDALAREHKWLRNRPDVCVISSTSINHPDTMDPQIPKILPQN